MQPYPYRILNPSVLYDEYMLILGSEGDHIRVMKTLKDRFLSCISHLACVVQAWSEGHIVSIC